MFAKTRFRCFANSQLNLFTAVNHRWLIGLYASVQSALITDKEHSRKLEVKLTSQKGLAEMTVQWKNAKAKVKQMEDTVMEAESRLLAAEEVQRQQKAEINTLRCPAWNS
eukprot:scaffold310499_cov32-Prasinocladus_malaysianus.AAC.1